MSNYRFVGIQGRGADLYAVFIDGGRSLLDGDREIALDDTSLRYRIENLAECGDDAPAERAALNLLVQEITKATGVKP